MTIRPIRCLSTFGLPALISALTSSCSTAPAPGLHKPAVVPQAAGDTHPRIAQLGYSEHAHYAACRPSACPSVTPKTLALESPAPAVALLPQPSEPTQRHERGLIRIEGKAGERASVADSATEWTASQVTVHFAFGSAALTPAARGQIDAAVAATPDDRRVSISGRTDSLGPAAVNDALAFARANAVRDRLLNQRPQLSSSTRLEAKGSCCYVASNDTPQGRAQNRRVEIVFDRGAADP